MDVHLVTVEPRGLRRALVEAGRRDGHVEELEHRRALGAAVYAGDARKVVGRDAALLVRRARERDVARRARHEVGDLHRVPHRVNVGIGGTHVGIDDNRAARVDRKPRLLRKTAVGAYPDRQQHEVGVQDAPLEGDGHAAVRRGGKGLHAVLQQQAHPLGGKVALDEAGHVVVERADHMVRQLDDGDR